MSILTADSPRPRRAGLARIAVAWLVAASASTAANLVLFVLAHALLTVPARFQPLQTPAFVAGYTVAGTLGAALLLGLTLWLSSRSPAAFRLGLAGAVLVATLGAAVTTTPPAVLLAAGLAGAAVTFAVAGRYRARPLAAFQVVAAIVLAISLVLPLDLVAGPFAARYRDAWDATAGLAAVLAAMHVLTAAITIGVLTVAMRRAGQAGLEEPARA